MPLEFAGLGLSLKQQAAPLTFRVAKATPNLSIGKPVTVILQSAKRADRHRAAGFQRGARAKRAADRLGEDRAGALRAAHRALEPLDGQRVTVPAGVKPDVRVVTEGATLLNQIR